MKISVDAMGGDFAPEEIIKGSVVGAREYDVGIILVGPQEIIKTELAKYDTSGIDIEIEHTDEYLLEGEHAAYAMRRKRNASIMVAAKLVKEGRAAAAIGVGPTGGVFAAAVQALGVLEGLARPVIGGQFLGFAPDTIMIDLGGNVDSRPDQLLDFGIIGTVYARKWMNIPNPTIALASNGVEEGKGNEVVKDTYELFKNSGLNFVGNVEGNDIALGKANIIICDGFVGNLIAKFCEGMGTVTTRWLMERLQDKLPESEMEALISDLKRAMIPRRCPGRRAVVGNQRRYLQGARPQQSPGGYQHHRYSQESRRNRPGGHFQNGTGFYQKHYEYTGHEYLVGGVYNMSDSPSVEETVRKIVTRIVRKQEGEFTPTATFKDLKADSLDVVQILVAVEDEYDIEIPDDELQNATDMESFIACIERVIARKNG
ncbi:MAG: phosphopantetheine-binding protein [Chloroflexota bacterium]